MSVEAELTLGLNNVRTDPLGRNWDSLFKEGQEIWLQNVSDTICSMQFETAHGNFLSFHIPIGGAPVAITREVPLDVLAKSPEFRRWVNRTPTIVRVLSEQETIAWYTNMARERKIMTPLGQPDVAQAVTVATEERAAARNIGSNGPESTYTTETGQVMFTPPKTAMDLMGQPSIYPNLPQGGQPAGSSFGPPQGFVNGPSFGAPQGFVNGPQDSQARDDEGADGIVVKSRIIDLCHQVSTEIPVSQRLTADQMLKRLREYEVSMTPADLQYVASNGGFNTVRRWASTKLEAR